MALTPAQVQAIINAEIIANGTGAITGPILNGILTDIINLFYTVPSATLAGLLDVDVVEGAAINNFTLTWNQAEGVWVAAVGGSTTTGSVTLRQFKLALANSNLMEEVTAGIPASTNNAVNIEWTSALSVIPGDVLAQNVQTTLSYSGSQMTALFNLAATLTP